MCVFLFHELCEVLMQSLDTAGRNDFKGSVASPGVLGGWQRGCVSLRPQTAWAGHTAAGKLRSRPACPALPCPVSRSPFTVRLDLQPSLCLGLLWTIPIPLPCSGSQLCFEMTDKVINCKANSKKPLQTHVCLWICTRPGETTVKGLEKSLAP